jgi:hypothetical protein
MDDKNHLWSTESIPHRIEQDGKTILLRQCSLCGRDFAQGIGGWADAQFTSECSKLGFLPMPLASDG